MSETAFEPCSCSALRQASRHLTKLYDHALAPIGLSLNQYAILSRLERLGPKTLQELADTLVMDRSTLGHLLRPLDERGLLSISPSAEDRRQRIIALTEAGTALVLAARPLWAEAEQQFQRLYGVDQARDLRSALKQVTRTTFLT